MHQDAVRQMLELRDAARGGANRWPMTAWSHYVRMPPTSGRAPHWIAKVIEYEGAVLLRIPRGYREDDPRLPEQGQWLRSWLGGRDGVEAHEVGSWQLRDRALAEALVAEWIADHGAERIDCRRYFALLNPARRMFARVPPKSGDAPVWIVKVTVSEYQGEQVMEIPLGGRGPCAYVSEQDSWFADWLRGRDGIKQIWEGTWRIDTLALAEALIEELVDQHGGERIDFHRHGDLRLEVQQHFHEKY